VLRRRHRDEIRAEALTRARWRTAFAGEDGLLVVHVSEPMVMLTEKGREAARG
jgi:hypothetical protein